jgi:linoleate 10R-lipoxygenase
MRDQLNQFVWARNDDSDVFLRQLLTKAQGADKETDELAASILAEVVATAPLYSSALAHVIEFYLDDGRARERADIAVIAAEPHSAAAEAKLVKYIREALRK